MRSHNLSSSISSLEVFGSSTGRACSRSDQLDRCNRIQRPRCDFPSDRASLTTAEGTTLQHADASLHTTNHPHIDPVLMAAVEATKPPFCDIAEDGLTASTAAHDDTVVDAGDSEDDDSTSSNKYDSRPWGEQSSNSTSRPQSRHTAFPPIQANAPSSYYAEQRSSNGQHYIYGRPLLMYANDQKSFFDLELANEVFEANAMHAQGATRQIALERSYFDMDSDNEVKRSRMRSLTSMSLRRQRRSESSVLARARASKRSSRANGSAAVREHDVNTESGAVRAEPGDGRGVWGMLKAKVANRR